MILEILLFAFGILDLLMAGFLLTIIISKILDKHDELEENVEKNRKINLKCSD